MCEIKFELLYSGVNVTVGSAQIAVNQGLLISLEEKLYKKITTLISYSLSVEFTDFFFP